MQIILLEKIGNLGDLGDEVKVKAGYARNYLIPHGKAVRATEEAKAKVEERRKELEIIAAEKMSESEKRAAGATKAITLKRRVADADGKLFGSVTASDIAEAMSEEGTEISRSEPQMPDGPLKQLGDYEIEVILQADVRFGVTVSVVSDGDMPVVESPEEDDQQDDESQPQEGE
ncbi:MAG: 50S ribosomal protein L9 [Arenicellales bacterium]|jgi:large subunit ribosomal protein L9|nr:50S ribosomal protein L9 [Acidiferrobacteraceae bacterium]MDP6123090.1 50S ribosomal protein L9 [Arenicellales bacterium]MBT59375.1 50S ribosomal protein L9 [Acidiferrobacteraceae bacterium]MDP6289039.1 50S ribosomal protein L9 [Arenicellales bacterium]MDP6435589.1 50S ribosomal protein L9 [Arenicellales bacterium]|tara:strand:- start:8529 stop:9050 length:522 start_codon:yes stop_codon:yes gene_type:complete